eukprot:4178168-Alexandrium_andersonii.AAC.1
MWSASQARAAGVGQMPYVTSARAQAQVCDTGGVAGMPWQSLRASAVVLVAPLCACCAAPPFGGRCRPA